MYRVASGIGGSRNLETHIPRFIPMKQFPMEIRTIVFSFFGFSRIFTFDIYDRVFDHTFIRLFFLKLCLIFRNFEILFN